MEACWRGDCGESRKRFAGQGRGFRRHHFRIGQYWLVVITLVLPGHNNGKGEEEGRSINRQHSKVAPQIPYYLDSSESDFQLMASLEFRIKIRSSSGQETARQNLERGASEACLHHHGWES